MAAQPFLGGGIIDAHVHMGPLTEADNLLAVQAHTGIERMALVAIQDAPHAARLAAPLYMKARRPEVFYVFAGLNHAHGLSQEKIPGPDLAEQLDAYLACGCDGVKLIEGKPTFRRLLDIPVTAPYYADFWKRAEELSVPIIWHVADPEEFWDPARLPAWAAARQWGYGPDDVAQEQLYQEVAEILRRHPGLRITFAHFYFLSADLDRASDFLDAHPNVCFDLALGVEMAYNISRNVAAGREFFARYADRIVFGTDLMSRMTPTQGQARVELVRRWLETDDTFRVPPEADDLLGPPEDGIIHGLALPEEILEPIYSGNFNRMVAPRPRPLDHGRVVQLCRTLAQMAAALSGCRPEETEAAEVARLLG